MRTVGGYTLFFSGNDPYSNWFISPMVVKRVEFNCVEQFMMFSKAALFRDRDTAMRILDARLPADQKRLGRQVRDYKDEVWCEHRLSIVAQGCYAKFTQNAHLRDLLLATGSNVLVEASPYDKVWGVGLAEDDPRVLDPSRWRGSNLLGQALMATRQRIAADMAAEHAASSSNTPRSPRLG